MLYTLKTLADFTLQINKVHFLQSMHILPGYPQT